MAFDAVSIQIRLAGGSAVTRYREDGVVAQVATFSLSDARGVDTYAWELRGRPEGSASGGVGPEPIGLGFGATCSITLDLPGAYVVACTINGGSPNKTVRTAEVAVPETITDPQGRALRLLGPGETDEDNADALVSQGWIKQLNRWLRALAAEIDSGGGAPVDAFTVVSVLENGALSGFGSARKLYLTGAPWLCGIDATGCVPGTILECTLDADTTVYSANNETNYADVVLSPGTPTELSLAQYSRFSVQLVTLGAGPVVFWQFHV